MSEKGFLQDVRHNLWDVQIAGMIFQTGSNAVQINFQHYSRNILKIYCVRVSIT